MFSAELFFAPGATNSHSVMTNATLTLNACAKINLTLDVFSKRADGYHEIASVMQTISLHDTLHFTRREEPSIRFTCDAPDAPDVPTDATNLVVRAAQLVIDTAQASGHAIEGGVEIHLEKRIPSQAGLGGGSSNAATALRGVQTVLGLDDAVLPLKTLQALAAQLGSDVPFFLIGGTASARGRGEKLSALPDCPQLALVIVKPDESVSTAWAYNALDDLPNRKSHRGTKRMEEALRSSDHDRIIAFQSNDFELPIFEYHPKLAWLHDDLMMAGCLTARLCGSGSALYGIVGNAGEAERVAALLRKKYPRTHTAHTLTRAQANSEPAEGTI